MTGLLWSLLTTVLIAGGFFAGTLLLFGLLWAVDGVCRRIRGE